MPGTLSQADLIADLKLVLMDSADRFNEAEDGDFKRHLDLAAVDLGRVRSRELLGSITISVGVAAYDAPADLIRHSVSLWGQNERRTRCQWESNWPGRLPRVAVIEGANGKQLLLQPAPSSLQITALGSDYQFLYMAAHKVDADAANTTVQAEDRWLLIIRAAAQAMQELAHQGVTKPVTMGTGAARTGSQAKNGTPAALAELLMKQFKEMAA